LLRHFWLGFKLRGNIPYPVNNISNILNIVAGEGAVPAHQYIYQPSVTVGAAPLSALHTWPELVEARARKKLACILLPRPISLQ
jgi:hypothetical protein